MNETVRLADPAAEDFMSIARVRRQEQPDANETYCDSVVRFG
jgi:hypothetical protein